MSKEPLVVVRCATYNHNPILRQCLDGIVMQKTSFPVIAVVHDDCSTDGTTDILREYAKNYPDIILPMYETENQWSKYDGELDNIIDRKMNSLNPKYICYCEGDDYWTDPYKLQKQVDYMESHPNCTCYTHNSICLNTRTGEIRLFNKRLLNTQDFSLESFLNMDWFTPTQSILYRASSFKEYEDMPLFMHGDYYLLVNVLLEKGTYLHYSNEIMGVYRDGGWASALYDDKELELYDDFVALLEYFKEKSNHRYDEVFDRQIALKKKGKEQYIQQMQEAKNSKKLINRIKRKLTRIFKAIC